MKSYPLPGRIALRLPPGRKDGVPYLQTVILAWQDGLLWVPRVAVSDLLALGCALVDAAAYEAIDTRDEIERIENIAELDVWLEARGVDRFVVDATKQRAVALPVEEVRRMALEAYERERGT